MATSCKELVAFNFTAARLAHEARVDNCWAVLLFAFDFFRLDVVFRGQLAQLRFRLKIVHIISMLL